MIDTLGFEALFDNASIGIVVMNSSGQIVALNKFLLGQFGYKTEELIGKSIEVLMPERFRNIHVQRRSHFFGDPLNRPMAMGLELFAVTKSGREFPVEVSLSHYSVNGCERAAAYINDISQRKASEQALRDLNAELDKKVQERTVILKDTIDKLALQINEVEAKDQELKKVNSYLQSIWNYAGAIVIVTDHSGLIELFNHAAEKHLGYLAGEVIGKETPLLFHDFPEVEACAEKLSREFNIPVKAGFETFTVKAGYNITDQGEWTYIAKSGRRIPVNLSITALRNADDEITGYMGIASDISARKQAEVELQSALQKEKEVNELKSRFVSIASHEFRTPLSTIHSSAYLISQYKTAEDEPKRKRHVERIISSANMLTDILNDFLSLGKIEEGKIQVREKEINVPEYMNAVFLELDGLRKNAQEIIIHHEGGELFYTDPAIMRHIIYNLVSNALKFSPESGRVFIQTKCDHNELVLCVKDQGIGIPEDDQKFLFDLFYRASNVGNIHGTGLGLHIIKRYVEMLGGNIEYQSRVNEGTAFKLTFKK
jgi:PAS domain S-box-containing protein